jgi:hypothetical protein
MRVEVVMAGPAGEVMQGALQHWVRDGATMTRLLVPTAAGAAELARRLRAAHQDVVDVRADQPRMSRTRTRAGDLRVSAQSVRNRLRKEQDP